MIDTSNIQKCALHIGHVAKLPSHVCGLVWSCLLAYHRPIHSKHHRGLQLQVSQSPSFSLAHCLISLTLAGFWSHPMQLPSCWVLSTICKGFFNTWSLKASKNSSLDVRCIVKFGLAWTSTFSLALNSVKSVDIIRIPKGLCFLMGWMLILTYCTVVIEFGETWYSSVLPTLSLTKSWCTKATLYGPDLIIQLSVTISDELLLGPLVYLSILLNSAFIVMASSFQDCEYRDKFWTTGWLVQPFMYQ